MLGSMLSSYKYYFNILLTATLSLLFLCYRWGNRGTEIEQLAPIHQLVLVKAEIWTPDSSRAYVFNCYSLKPHMMDKYFGIRKRVLDNEWGNLASILTLPLWAGHITLLFRFMKPLKQIELWDGVYFSGKSSHSFHQNLREIHMLYHPPQNI